MTPSFSEKDLQPLQDMLNEYDGKYKCPKCGSEANPKDTCVGCKSRYIQLAPDSLCFICTRTITPDGEHELGDIDHYEHECGHEKKVKT
jgi:hypothetical protein